MRLMDINYCSEKSTVVSASSSDPSFPVSNLKHPFRSKRWRSLGATSGWVAFDFQTTEEIDSVVILWPKEDGIRLTNTATLRVQASHTNVWTSPAVDELLTIDNQYIMASHYFTTDQSYRYWRVVVEDDGNPWECVELGVVWIGKSLPVENAQNGFTYELIDMSKRTSTDFGHVYTDEYPQKASIEFAYELLDYSAVQVLENAYRRNGNRKPVMVVVDPDEAVFNRNHLTVYGLMSNTFGLSHLTYNILNTDSISIEELS